MDNTDKNTTAPNPIDIRSASFDDIQTLLDTIVYTTDREFHHALDVPDGSPLSVPDVVLAMAAQKLSLRAVLAGRRNNILKKITTERTRQKQGDVCATLDS